MGSNRCARTASRRLAAVTGLFSGLLWASAALAGVALQSFEIDPPVPEPEPPAARPVFSPAADLPAHDARVGTLAGQAATEGGAATYTVPIVVPPGRAGMEPRLSLVYNSRSGDGVMGMGWSISGLSAIHRCPQTPEQDGATFGVNYTNSDRLCLDGQRLVKVAGTYGTSGAEYRTEVDSYARIVQTGGDLTGSGTCFRVEQKDGRILHYGAVTTGVPLATGCATPNANSRVQPSGVSSTLSWLVEKIEDRSGNHQLYSYTDAGNGEVLPDTIRYSGYGTTAGDRMVVFAYDARATLASTVTDYASSYLAGGLTLQTKALKSITTTALGAAVRKITPTYTVAAYNGRLLLKSLEECAYSGTTPTCHPATRFAMNDSAYAPTLTSLGDLGIPNTGGASPTASVSAVRVIADLDGDGTRETAVSTVDTNGVTRYYLVQMTADRVVHSAVQMPEGQLPFSTDYYADFDNDGRSEVIKVPASAGDDQHIQLGVWTLGRGVVATGNPLRMVPVDFTIPWGEMRDIRAADIDGDGRQDLLISKTTAACQSDSLGNKVGVFVYLNTNSPGVLGTTAHFTTPSAPLFCLARTGSGAGVVAETVDRVTDFNGDGLPDIFIRSVGVNVNGLVGVRLVQRSGSTLSTTLRSCALMGLTNNPGGTNDECGGTPGPVVRWVDVNGDGLEDFVIARPGENWKLRLNRGGTLGAVIDTGSSAGLDTFPTTTGPFFRSFRYAGSLPTMDVDGDGKPELLIVSAARKFAMKMCTFTSVPVLPSQGVCPPRRSPDSTDPVDPNDPLAGQCPAYACPEDPGTNDLNMPQESDGSYSWQGMFVFGNYAHPYQGYIGLADHSAYHLARLKFVQTGASAFRLDLAETPLISKLTGHPDDLYGDGLNDLVTSIGGRTARCEISLGGTIQLYDCQRAIGDGTYGPAALPDGTATSSLQRKTVVYANVNPGVTGPNQLLSNLPDLDSRIWDIQSSAPAPILPGVIWSAVDGLGDWAGWAHTPLAFPQSAAGIPLYTVPSANGYDDARHYYFTSTMPVASAMLQGSGTNDNSMTRSAIYGYDSAIYNNGGRGFQGFRKIIAQDGNRLRTTTTYHQKFPLTGKIASVQTAVARDNTGSPLDRVQTETYTWRCTRTNRGALCPGDNQTALPVPTGGTLYQPFLDQQQVQNFDLGTGNLTSQIDTVNANDATTSGWDSEACNTGSGIYGNLNNQVVTRADKASGGLFVSSHTTTTKRCYDLGGSSNWWVDKLTNATVTSSVTYGTDHALPSGAAAPDQTRRTAYTWQADRTPATQTVQAGVVNQQSTTTWTYPTPTSYGLPSQVSVNAPDLSTDRSPTRTTSYAYTKDGTTAAADGYFVLTATNGLGQATTTTVQPRDGQVLRTTDPNGVDTVNTYDVFGRPIRTDYLNTADVAYAASEQRAWTSCLNTSGATGNCGALVGEDINAPYAAYRVTTVRNGYPTRVDWFDVLNRPIKHAERGFSGAFIASLTDYDTSGRVAGQSTPYFLNTTTPYFTGWEYDALGRPTKKIEQVGQLDPDNGDLVTEYAYTGRATTITVRAFEVDPPGPSGCPNTTSLCLRMTRATNVLGQLMRTTQKLGATDQVTQYWTDPQGAVAAIRSPDGGLVTARYNALGYRTSGTDVDRGASTFTVDAFGELLTQTDARGVVTTVTKRDALGRPIERTAVPPATVPTGLQNETVVDRWSYDPANGIGQLDQQKRLRGTNRTSPGTNPEVWRESYGYEAQTARLSTTTTTISEGTPVVLASSQTYDAVGRLGTRTYPNPGGAVALKVRYGYTDSGLLEELSNDTTNASYWSASAANQWGHITQESWGSLSGSHQDYASTGQRYQLSWTGTGGSDQVTYGYDSFGNLRSQKRSVSGGSAPTERYRYDQLQRLIGSDRPGAIVTYGYTASGNLDRKSDFSANTAGAYGYGANGCGPHAVSSVVLAANAGTATYGCDAAGNQISGSAITATYDAENRPRIVQKTLSSPGTPACRRGDTIFCNGFEKIPPVLTNGGTTWTYATDGSRMTENTAQGPRYFGRDGFEWANNTAIHELGPVVVRRTASGDQVLAVLKDSLGSTVATVSSVANRRSYDAFGAARNADYSPRPNGTLNLPATIHGFTGHTHADDVALIHMGGRIYDPDLGRFLSTDPIIQNLADGQSINPYSYVLNNPFSGRDPTGYAIQCHDTKTCGMPDAPTQDEQQRKKSGPLLPKGNGANGLTPNGPSLAPVDGQAPDIGAMGRTINGLGVTQLDNVVVRPDQDWVASRDVTWNIYGAERAAWVDRLAQQSGYDMIRGFYGFQWEMWRSQFTGDVPAVGVSGVAGGLMRGVAAAGKTAEVAGETITLYRAVTLAELKQIQATGSFEAGANSLGGKWFAETLDHARQWGEVMNGKGISRIIEVKLPRSQADQFMRMERLDGIGPARYGELDQLRGAVIKEVNP